MKKHNLKKSITRILACALLVATLGLSLASCTAGDKVKDTAGKAWDTAVDGAKRIYDTAKDKITMEQISGNQVIRLVSATTTSATVFSDAVSADTARYYAVDFLNSTETIYGMTNGGADYAILPVQVCGIRSVIGAEIFTGNYQDATDISSSEPAKVFIDDATGYLGVLTPSHSSGPKGWLEQAHDLVIEVDIDPALSYARVLKASDFVGNWTNTNGKGALYVQSKQCVGTITSVTGATMGDYWFAEPGEKPVVAIDGNNSKLSVLLPAGYTDVETWAAAAADFSITVTPVMEKTLQATVLPESATDKSVTWSVSATEEGVDASEYIRLLTFDGAAENKVTVLALKPFEGHEFRIVCTTNIGGFTAECKVTYEGEASKLYLYMSNSDGSETLMPGLLQTSDSEKPVFLVGSTTDFRLALDNVFHQVGHSANYEVTSISLNGTIKVDKMSYNQTGSKLMETIDNYDISKHVNDFVTVTLEGDTLKVKVDKAIESWIGDALGSSSSGWYYQFNSFAESGMPYFVVSIRDTVSGLCTAVRFHIKSTVQSVSLSENALTF